MRKQKFIHLHGLLAEVYIQIEAWGDEGVNLVEYNELGVRSASIHKSKTDYKVAVSKLAKGIIGMMRKVEPEPLASQTD